MASKADREGLSLGYRISYRVRWFLFTFYGPPRLDAPRPVSPRRFSAMPFA